MLLDHRTEQLKGLVMRIIATLMLLFVSAAAHAVPVTWNFTSVLFDDGGSVDAVLDFDSDLSGVEAYSNLSVMTTSGTLLSGATYTTSDLFFATPSKIKLGNKVEVVFAGKLNQAPPNGIGLFAVI